MRPFDNMLLRWLNTYDKTNQEQRPDDKGSEICETNDHDVADVDEINRASASNDVCIAKNEQQDVIPVETEIMDLSMTTKEEKEQLMEVDEFSSRETVRKLVNVDDDKYNDLVRLAENSRPVIELNKSIDGMKKYCEENGIKPNFSVTRKQFLRFREKCESKTIDYSWHPKNKKSKEYEVEAILDYNTETNKYLVKWVGWSHESNTWEPEAHLESCKESFNEFCMEKEEFVKNNLGSQWHKNVLNLQLIMTKITSKDYEDRCVLTKLSDNFASTQIIKKQITEKTRILEDITTDSFKDCVFGSKRIAKIICDNLNIQKNFGSLELFFDFVERRKITLKRLKTWEEEVNQIILNEGKSKKIYVENEVDLEGPPPDFIYITECKMNIDDETNRHFEELNKNPVSWCSHSDCYEDKKNCCPKILDSKFVYTKEGSLRDRCVLPIVECNAKCACSIDCPNRVIQKGTQAELVIFRTNNGRGWGVKAKQRILARHFVMEYIGEVISVEEADERGKRYDTEGRTYLFDLDFDVESECAYSVDATRYGNVSHFVNHSCDPNLEVFVAWINHLDRQLPRLVFFSKRQISKGEELTFDYKMTRPDLKLSDVQIECKCGAEVCKKFLYI